jgi:DNA gyrase/topoisomerase IV subunit B
MKMVFITVEDNGRGISVVSIKRRGFGTEVVMTKIGAGGNLIRIPSVWRTSRCWGFGSKCVVKPS